MILLYKESALSPLSVMRSAGDGMLGKAFTLPATASMIGGAFLGPDNPVMRAIGSTYGRIPIVGKYLYGGMDPVKMEGLQKIKDPGVRSQLFRTQDGSFFSPKKTMHGSDAIKHHLMSNAEISAADVNNPIFKNIRELSTNPDTARGFQTAVEQGRTSYLKAPGGNRNLMRRLSSRDQEAVREQQGRFKDQMVGAVIGTDRPY
jgi:hypothetical protein